MIFFFLKKKVQKNHGKDGVGKMKKKTYFVVLSKARSILELMLCNRNLTKRSISNFVKFRLQSISSKIERAFEKTTKFSIKIRLKRTLIRQLKRTINQCKISYMRQNTFFL